MNLFSFVVIEAIFILNQEQFYDFVRMLDGEGYPRAFLNYGKLRLEFFGAMLKSGHVELKVKVVKNG